MIGDGFSVWFFSLSLLASSSITKNVPEPIYGLSDTTVQVSNFTHIQGTADRAAEDEEEAD